jgi:hypothetical protein
MLVFKYHFFLYFLQKQNESGLSVFALVFMIPQGYH